MISKGTLQSVISKYHLNGLNNQVKWRIKDNTLTVYAGERGRVCKVHLNDFPLEDGELGIFDTGKLNKLLSITSGNLELKLDKIKSVFTRLHISDSNFDLTYSLADILILGKTTWYEDPAQYEIELNLSREDIDHLIKAKGALADVDNMLITSNNNLDGDLICEFIFGDNTGFSNKITYQLQGTILKNNISIPFNSDIFKDILSSNKEMDSAKLRLSELGMMNIEFTSSDIQSSYYIARNE
jgi:hypothetical protein